jgi:dephospho-CoA kinase
LLKVGLTGGLASGKTTAAGVFRELGAAVFDADVIVKDLYRPGGEGTKAARELFGDAVLDRKGGVDRGRVALIVFQDAAKRKLLEDRLHPLVRQEIARRFEVAEKRGAIVGIAEASQLLETKTEDCYDRVVLVTADQAERVRRWVAKGNDATDGRRRIASQISQEEAKKRVTDFIDNDGSFESLRRQVQALYLKWTTPPRPAS